MTNSDLMEIIENFLLENKISPTSFGVRIAKDPCLVFTMRKGREVREAKRNKILSFIENYEKSLIGVGQCVKHR